jgi:hypothetical protein
MRQSRLAERGGCSPFHALLRRTFSGCETNFQGAHEATPVFHVNLARGFGIKLHKLPA